MQYNNGEDEIDAYRNLMDMLGLTYPKNKKASDKILACGHKNKVAFLIFHHCVYAISYKLKKQAVGKSDRLLYNTLN